MNDNNARFAGKPRVTGRFVTQYGTPPSNSIIAPSAMSHKDSFFAFVDPFSLKRENAKTHTPTMSTTAMYNALVRDPLALGFGNWKI